MDPAPSFPYVNRLRYPVIGLESEFRVFVNDVAVVPEDLWRSPQDFISDPLVPRTSKSSQLPTGGAIYFDGGVIELVTPVIELAPNCTGRVVRNMWEQIGYVRDQLDRYQNETGKRVRLEAFSCHVNLSFELPRDQRSSDRTVQKLALLLATILPVPVIVLGANRRSTGIGVRPRRDRIEITLDFTPDPGLMAATVALIAGVTRGVIAWPSYRLEEVARRGLAVPAGLSPGKHPTRNGWIARAAHMGRNPFTSDIDAADWVVAGGPSRSLRQIAQDVAVAFAEPIRELADPFSVRLLFSIVRGDTRALLDLPDRPVEYDDIGHSTYWGSVLGTLDHYAGLLDEQSDEPRRRASDVERLGPPWRGGTSDRRAARAGVVDDRRVEERRHETPQVWPELSRSAYEVVFTRAARRTRLRVGGKELIPAAFHGWYHIEFEIPGGGTTELSLDQILDHGDWIDDAMRENV